MNITLLKSKIHRAVVTQADLDYVGSVTIDTNLLREAGIMEYEKVQIVDINNGNRFETYTIAGEEGSGIICLNGAAAKCVNVGDKVIIMAYADMSTEEATTHKPTVLFVNDKNQIVRKANYEKHGLLNDQ
jgi:aspartate 1-decarboxylase